jgi:hypothetical protein
MQKSKPTVIDISEEKQDAARKILESKFFLSKNSEVNANSGFCCICRKVAQKIVKTDVSDADDDGKVFRVERYCDQCLKRWVLDIEKNC